MSKECGILINFYYFFLSALHFAINCCQPSFLTPHSVNYQYDYLKKKLYLYMERYICAITLIFYI